MITTRTNTMKQHIHRIPRALSIAIACALSTSAMAVTPNIYTGSPTVVNPFTGLATDIWKFAGYTDNHPSGGRCSAVQITPKWVIATKHCPLNDYLIFRNGWSTDPRGSTFDCDETTNGGHKHPEADVSICRLTNPERFSPPADFPPMINRAALDLIANRGLGSVFHVGYSGGTAPTMNFGLTVRGAALGVNSYNIGRLGAVGSAFSWNGGDSGGAVYWFGANDGRPSFYVNISGGSSTVDWVSWARGKITDRGDTPPAVLNEQDVLLRASAVVPPPLATRPSVRVTGVGKFSVSWTPPTLSSIEQIDDYQLYEGTTADAPRKMFVSGTSALITGAQEASQHRLCVAPRNDGLESISELNCVTFDSYYPIVSGLQITSSGTTSLKSVRTSWSVRGASTSVVKYTIKSAAGSTRTGNLSVSTGTFTVGVAVGSEFCVQVNGTTLWSDGAVSSACQVIR